MTPPIVTGQGQRMKVGSTTIERDGPLFLLAGPCVIEDERSPFAIARELRDLAAELGMPFIFKASFDKANRTSADSFRGPGPEEGLALLDALRHEVGVPVVTDIHEPSQAALAAGKVDMLQIPAFLCRQTDLLLAAAATGLPVNIKKGQFLAPWDMVHSVEKVRRAGNPSVLVTERGNCFGYNTLVTDMRSIPALAALDVPVIFDATHSVQRPGGDGKTTGGDRTMAPVLARAAVAAGAHGVFAETHPDPDGALSDGPNMIPLAQMRELLVSLQAIRRALGGH